MTISTNIEISEALHSSITEYIETHPAWSQERVMQAALSLFLLQNGANQAQVSEVYLDSLFGG
ncbi:DUF2811 domain-containing protein [Adonisia turfae]|uniref:DUF2811 domain-containing protein n=1 Tax=Adonisia turfae CCMR0081 TaxID=2292702 RepID=A0A6M0RGT7_9CYAN|nr:DUF2811 domain-containing protein [Adonisia turfae]NEZ55464.1 DUF2811 domain-containing protein [Adonisia turfae CCMR0081]